MEWHRNGAQVNEIDEKIYFDDLGRDIAGRVYLTFSYAPLIVQSLIVLVLVFLIYLVFSFLTKKRVNRIVSDVDVELVHLLKRLEISSLNEKDLFEFKYREFQSISATFNKLIFDLNERNTQIMLEKRKGLYVKIAKQVAHDIRSPLTAIEMISQTGGEINAEKAELLKSSSARLKAIANDLLEQSKSTKPDVAEAVDAGDVSEVAVEVSSVQASAICQALESVVSEKKVEYSSSDIKVSFYNNVTNDTSVKCDLVDIGRIVSNLMNNSIEAIDGRGLVTVDISNEGSRLLIEVRDTGCGISSDKLEEVFREGVSLNKHSGNGLGLSHTKASVESWGGSVRLSSKVGQGTTVSICLV